jgi:hypothetical protein
MFPAREEVSPYRFIVSMRILKWLNLWCYWNVWQIIKTMEAQLRTNEISLLDINLEERYAAKKQEKTSDY